MQGSYQQMSKAELHLHLEGTIEPETLLELAPQLSLDDVRARYRCSSFPEFLESFKFAVRSLNGPDDYALVTRRLAGRLAAENVRYAEVTLSAGALVYRRRPLDAVLEAVIAESRPSPVEIRWVLDGIRHFGPEHVLEVAQAAARHAGEDVVAFGIGGDEQAGPVEQFGDAFRVARDAGLHLTIHAGETAGPESVWGALAAGAERIGHGIRAIEDPALLACLRDRQVPLEVCISSNVATGAVPGLAEHPLRRLYDAGVPIVLGTDDPAIFGTTLAREYEIAAREFGFTDKELQGIVENGFRYRFVPRAASG